MIFWVKKTAEEDPKKGNLRKGKVIKRNPIKKDDKNNPIKIQ
jgi:hypothetical protein